MSRKYIPVAIRRAVFRRDGGRCVYCGATADDMTLALDHQIPRSRGGEDTVENLVVACFPCNGDKGTRTPEEWRGSGHV